MHQRLMSTRHKIFDDNRRASFKRIPRPAPREVQEDFARSFKAEEVRCAALWEARQVEPARGVAPGYLVPWSWPSFAAICGGGSETAQCQARGSFNRFPAQFCRCLDRLSDHLALHCSESSRPGRFAWLFLSRGT